MFERFGSRKVDVMKMSELVKRCRFAVSFVGAFVVMLCMMGCEDDSDHIVWTPELLERAERGDVEAMFRLGIRYDQENGERDIVEAVKWYTKAAELGHRDAQHVLGVLYVTGDGVPVDLEMAEKLLLKSAEQGNTAAQHDLALMYRNQKNDHEASLKWLLKSAEAGNVAAQLQMSKVYGLGIGVDVSPQDAFKWCERAANQGDALAQYNLGVYYYNGDGVARDREKAIEWLKKADAQGYESAKRALKIAQGTNKE